MFFSFVSFIINRGFFLTCLENIVYDDMCDDMMTSKMTQGYFFKIVIFGAEGKRVRLKDQRNRGPRANENKDPLSVGQVMTDCNICFSFIKKWFLKN